MKQNHLITLVLIFLITIFAVHIIRQNTKGWRADLTEAGLFTLTDGTKNILDKMHKEGTKPVTIKLYFSEKAGKTLPKFIKNFITYEDYVRNLLKEYQRFSKGKIELDFIDPVPDSDEAQDASDYGLDGKPINQHGDLFFFGLVLESQTGSKEIIEFLWPEKQETIEYDITKRLHSLIWPTQKRVGVLSSLEVLSDDSNPYLRQMLAAQGKQPKDSWVAMKLMQESYDVSVIDKNTDHISKDEYDLVLVIHPKSFSDKTLWALDEWIVTGGNTLIFLDPYSIEDQAPQNPQQPFAQYQYKPASNLPRLMDKWGLQREEDAIAVDYELAVKRATRQMGPAEKVIIDLLIDEPQAKQALAQDSPIFQGLKNLRFYMAGSLKQTGESELQYQPLIRTTDQGSTLNMQPGFPSDDNLALLDQSDPGKLLAQYRPDGEPVVMAYQIQGQFPTMFPQGVSFPESTPEPPPGMPPGFQMPPDEDAEMIEKQAVPADQYAEATVLVFADSDFISDQLAFQKSFFGQVAVNDNHKVLLNAVDFLLGSKELMDVRSKSSIQRPFKLFDEIEAQADAETLDREQEYRAEVERFQKELQEKQSKINQRNAALLEKKFRDELAELQAKKSEAERKLRDIRKMKREALDFQKAQSSFVIMWFTPILVAILGVILYVRRKLRAAQAKRGEL